MTRSGCGLTCVCYPPENLFSSKHLHGTLNTGILVRDGGPNSSRGHLDHEYVQAILMFGSLFRRQPREQILPVLLPEPVETQVKKLLSEGKHTEAVRLARIRTGLGLTSAVRAVNALVKPDSKG